MNTLLDMRVEYRDIVHEVGERIVLLININGTLVLGACYTQVSKTDAI